MDLSAFQESIKYAIIYFWHTRARQLGEQKDRNAVDQGHRGAVTGGKQMDGFIELFADIALHMGVPKKNIHTSGNYLPGFFRPSKDWDFLITTPAGRLVCAIELKSQVGSFGNNFNNRTEESLGSSFDLATSLAENSFPSAIMPWVGYLIVLEHSKDSTKKVKVQQKLFKVRPEFEDTSYLERYDLFCKRLMLKKLYNHASVIWSKPDLSFGDYSEETCLKTFLRSYIANLEFRMEEFK